MTRRGFTSIETVAALAMMAALAAGGLSTISSLSATLRLAASARTLAQTMRETRARALAEGRPLEVRFDASTHAWSIATPDGTIRRQEALPAPVRFAALPARARIRFDATGGAENGTIVLGTTAAVRRIVVNQRGRVRLA